MAKLPVVTFTKLEKPAAGTVVFLMGKDEELPAIAAGLDEGGRLARAIEINEFKGKAGSTVDLLAPGGKFERFVLAGAGDVAANGEHDWMKLGGKSHAVCAEKRNDYSYLRDGDRTASGRGLCGDRWRGETSRL